MAYEGHDAMYTGKPSKPGKTQVQIGYGLVEGDGVGYVDNADATYAGDGEWATGKVEKAVSKGLTKGKRIVTPSRKEQS